MTDQWERNRLNFEGVWQGNRHWYVRRDNGELDFRQPTSVVGNTRYAINFEDADTGLWEGTGLFFAPGGAAHYALSRSTYNASGAAGNLQVLGASRVWRFPMIWAGLATKSIFFTADLARRCNCS